MKTLDVILIGAGDRGIKYVNFMSEMKDEYRVVAVAEPIENRRDLVGKMHNIPEDMRFDDWRPLLEKGKIADVALICTMDRDHFEPAMRAIELGYDIMLEKPIAPTLDECREITLAASKKGVKVLVCTVLRYTNVFHHLKNIVDSGRLGRIMSVNHEENVGLIHQSHSFVRGNWGNSEESSNMLLQKSCHDIDILQWLLGKKCRSVQSFGTLSYFTRENAPEDSPEFCNMGCPHGDTCEFNAVKLYYDDKDNHWFRNACTKYYYPSDEMVWQSISETNYGRCVFKCNNDVVDHQTVNMLFEDDITVTFTMNAFNEGGRYIHIMGTKGELRAHLEDGSPLKIHYFADGRNEEIDVTVNGVLPGGHGGGDAGIVRALHEYLTADQRAVNIPDITQSYYNHAIVFAAEKSRAENTVVDFEEYFAEVDK